MNNEKRGFPRESLFFVYAKMELGFDQGQYFSVHTYSQQEWDKMNFTPFYKNVEQDKIVLV